MVRVKEAISSLLRAISAEEQCMMEHIPLSLIMFSGNNTIGF
jgi:hypothetical protein